MPSKERACGPCSACCKTHAVIDLEMNFTKPMGKWCEHCNPGRGCAIYEKRPRDCVRFKCWWREGNGEEADRPDLRKVVVDHVFPADGPENGLVQMWEVAEGGLMSRWSQERTMHYLFLNVVVTHVYLSGRKKVFLPKMYEGRKYEFETEPGSEFCTVKDLRI